MRFTRRVFHDLAIWMVVLGLGIGVVFPFFVERLGVPASIAFTPAFVTACLVAGALAGGLNYALARLIVGQRLRALASGMRRVEGTLGAMTTEIETARMTPDTFRIDVDSEDEIGDSARAFNRLVDALAVATQTQFAARSFAEMLTSELAIDGLARNALEQLLEHTGATAGAIVYDADGQLEVAAAQGIRDANGLVSSEPVREVMRSGRTRFAGIPRDVQVDAVVVDFRPRVVAVLPISHKGVPVGAVVLAAEQDFEADHRTRLELFLHGLGLALNNALAHDRLQTLAALDPLTGAYNRRFGLLRLHEEFGRAVRASTPLGVVMLDVDHFKAVNDTHGHVVGDRVLRSIAALTRSALREGDVLMRYGGEEFLAVLPAASSDDVRGVGERIRRLVEDSAVMEGEVAVRVTVSVGGVAYPNRSVEHEEGLVELADGALYRAKESGRNRVEIAR